MLETQIQAERDNSNSENSVLGGDGELVDNRIPIFFWGGEWGRGCNLTSWSSAVELSNKNFPSTFRSSTFLVGPLRASSGPVGGLISFPPLQQGRNS